MLHFRNRGVALINGGIALVAAIVLLSVVFAGHAMAATTGTTATATVSPTAITYRSTTIVPATGSGCNEFTLAPWYNCTTVTGSGDR